MSHEEYLARPEVNSSTIKACIKSPWAYRAMKQYPSEPSPAMLRGTLIHMALLEPERYAQEVRALPEDIKPNTKAHKEWKAEHHDKTLVTTTEREIIERCVASVREQSHLAELIDKSQHEVSCFWADWARSEVMMKARLDIWVPGDTIVDLKTTGGDVDLATFSRSLVTPGAGYAVQAAHYTNFAEMRGDAKTRFAWLVVQTCAPYEVALFEATQDVLRYGHEWRSYGLRRYVQARVSDEWPRANEGIVSAELPRWAPYPPRES